MRCLTSLLGTSLARPDPFQSINPSPSVPSLVRAWITPDINPTSFPSRASVLIWNLWTSSDISAALYPVADGTSRPNVGEGEVAESRPVEMFKPEGSLVASASAMTNRPAPLYPSWTTRVLTTSVLRSAVTVDLKCCSINEG